MGIGLAHWWSSVYRFAAAKHFFSRNSSNSSLSNRLLFCNFEWWIDCEEHLAAKNQFVFQQLHRSTLAYIFLFHSWKMYLCSCFKVLKYAMRKINIYSMCLPFLFVEVMQTLCKNLDILICNRYCKKRNSIYYYLHYYSRMNT